MLPVFGRPCEGPSRHAVIGTRGIATGNTISNSSGGDCIKWDVWLLRDPDAMKQHGELAGDGNDGTIAGLLAAARCQMQTPLT
jgi:hypothetical protein